MTEAEERAAVVLEARSWIGTPYHHAARVKGVGVDCAMLVAEVFHAAVPHRVPRIDPVAYPHDWHLHRDDQRYLAEVLRHAREVAVESAQPGDLVMFRFGRVHAHGGIAIGDEMMIHAYLGSGVVLQELTAGWLLDKCPRAFTVWP